METENQNQLPTTMPPVVAIICWVLAGFGTIIMFFKVLWSENVSSYYLGSLFASSLILFWMGHVVNYLKLIADKK
jgi:hypothetical protein